MASKLRVYWLPNWGGTRQTLVAAANQKEACELMQATVSGFRAYGGQRVDDLGETMPSAAEMVRVALSEPGKVWTRPIDCREGGWVSLEDFYRSLRAGRS